MNSTILGTLYTMNVYDLENNLIITIERREDIESLRKAYRKLQNSNTYYFIFNKSRTFMERHSGILEEENTNMKNQTYKEIVLKRTDEDEDVEITYDFLREQGACQKAIDYFVNHFGNKAHCLAVINELIHANEEDISKYHINKEEWEYWIKERVVAKNNNKICLEDIDFEKDDKFYILKRDNVNCNGEILCDTYYKHFHFNDKFWWVSITGDHVLYMLHFKHKKDFIRYPLEVGHRIFMYDSFEDFCRWYLESEK